MVDVVALASVLSSGAVALGGIWFGYRQSRLQQRHEMTMAYEERVWAEKSECLLRVSASATRLADAAWRATFEAQREPWADFAVTALQVASELDSEVARVTVYASEEMRVAYELLRADLNDRRVPRAAIRKYADTQGSSESVGAERDAMMLALSDLESESQRVRDDAILDPLYARLSSLEVVRLAGADLRRPIL